MVGCMMYKIYCLCDSYVCFYISLAIVMFLPFLHAHNNVICNHGRGYRLGGLSIRKLVGGAPAIVGGDLAILCVSSGLE